MNEGWSAPLITERYTMDSRAVTSDHSSGAPKEMKKGKTGDISGTKSIFVSGRAAFILVFLQEVGANPAASP